MVYNLGLIALIFLSYPIHADPNYTSAAITVANTVYDHSEAQKYLNDKLNTIQIQYVPNEAKKPVAIAYFTYNCLLSHRIAFQWTF